MPRPNDIYKRDASERELSTLEYVLEAEKRVRETVEIPVVSVESALQEKGVYEVTSERNVVRVLFISRDETLLNPAQQTLDGLVNLSELFDEVHVLILRTGIPAKYPVLRVAKNVWLYTATSRYWWWTPVAALRLIHEQLVFVGGLRPDLIVARDPFESAVVAEIAGRHYSRPTQLHILQDFTRDVFLKADRRNRWRRFLMRFMIKKFPSVRTATHSLQAQLEKRYTIADLKTLPRFNNYDTLITAKPTINLQEKYKPFAFIMLYIGRLGHESTMYRVLDAARSFLRNPRVGLVVIGDGPAKKEFEKRAVLLGIQRQVVFETRVTETVPYLKSAHVLVVTDIDSDADGVALQGAAAGIPMILAYNAYREDVFDDGVSALMFPPEDTEVLQTKINKILNEVALRRQLIITAQARIQEKFHDDPLQYRLAYRESIERALFTDTDTASALPPPKPV